MASRIAVQQSHVLDTLDGGADLDLLDKRAVLEADERAYVAHVALVRRIAAASATAPVARREYLNARLSALASVRAQVQRDGTQAGLLPLARHREEGLAAITAADTSSPNGSPPHSVQSGRGGPSPVSAAGPPSSVPRAGHRPRIRPPRLTTSAWAPASPDPPHEGRVRVRTPQSPPTLQAGAHDAPTMRGLPASQVPPHAMAEVLPATAVMLKAAPRPPASMAAPEPAPAALGVAHLQPPPPTADGAFVGA